MDRRNLLKATALAPSSAAAAQDPVLVIAVRAAGHQVQLGTLTFDPRGSCGTERDTFARVLEGRVGSILLNGAAATLRSALVLASNGRLFIVFQDAARYAVGSDIAGRINLSLAGKSVTLRNLTGADNIYSVTQFVTH